MVYQGTDLPALIKEYNDVVCGAKAWLRVRNITEDQLLAIGRYAFTYYLHWTPQDIEKRLTPEILKKLKLYTPFMKTIQFPHELNPHKDMFYYAHLMYPDIIPYNVRKQIMSIFAQVKNKERRAYPSHFFDDDYAMERAEICLQEAVKLQEAQNLADLYSFFASKDAIPFLKNFFLLSPMKMYYDDSPLVYLHAALPESDTGDFWYHYYLFSNQLKKFMELNPAGQEQKEISETEV